MSHILIRILVRIAPFITVTPVATVFFASSNKMFTMLPIVDAELLATVLLPQTNLHLKFS